MEFLARLFCNQIHWRTKKVFFDENAQDKHLIRLLLLKGITVVDSRETAELVIVRHHPSCWRPWKEITFADLYFYLSDADKYLYYIAKLKSQHRPIKDEKIFLVHNYMIVLNSSQKTFHVYSHEPIPFIDQKVYTKRIVKNQRYLRAWVDDYYWLRSTTMRNCADGFLIQLSDNRYMSIGNAVCIFEQDEKQTDCSLTQPSSTPFLLHSKFNLSKVFEKKTVWCRILHQG